MCILKKIYIFRTEKRKKKKSKRTSTIFIRRTICVGLVNSYKPELKSNQINEINAYIDMYIEEEKKKKKKIRN